MERHKLSSENAELIINTLRDNPGVDMTLADLSDLTAIPVDELAAYCADLASRVLIEHETTPDGFDVYRFPDEYQRGSTANST
jgi:hypothetical protein